MIVANLRDGGGGLAAKVTLAMGATALAAAAVVMTNGLSSERMTLRAAMHRRHGSAKVKDDMRNQQGVNPFTKELCIFKATCIVAPRRHKITDLGCHDLGS